MDEVRRELDRLRRAWKATRARVLTSRAHLLVLLAITAGAIGSRLWGPWPPFDRLEGSLLPALGAAAILLLSGTLVRHLVPLLLRVSRRRLARRLDDRMAWQDSVDTSLSLPDAETSRRPLQVFLAAQTAGRLRALAPTDLWSARRDRRWLRRIVVLLFLFVLLAPGVVGLFAERGAGRGEAAGLGTRPAPSPGAPLPLDTWIVTHVHEPLRAEPLETGAPPGAGGGR